MMTARPFKNQKTTTKSAIPDDAPSFAPYLENIAFPKSREALLQIIEENTENDTEDNQVIMERFRQIPDVTYNNINDVKRALGEYYENGNKKNTEENNVRARQTNRR